ncbi:hypothetical protein [Streptomyces scopuliridis]|uniref:hypothetical protein n=1 Tax=Streptomyces scopuliridis TaxID=452529 RepID=UPI0034470F92
MTMDVRATSNPNRFDLYEDDQLIGEINGVVVDDEPYWCAKVWSQMGTGKEWGADDASSFDEIKEWARELYDEMVAERRELMKGSRPPTISTPMGGQRRK